MTVKEIVELLNRIGYVAALVLFALMGLTIVVLLCLNWR